MAGKSKDVAALLALKFDSEAAIKEAKGTCSATIAQLTELGANGEKLEKAIENLQRQRDTVVEYHTSILKKIRRQVALKVARLESADFDSFLKNDFVRQTLNAVK